MSVIGITTILISTEHHLIGVQQPYPFCVSLMRNILPTVPLVSGGLFIMSYTHVGWCANHKEPLAQTQGHHWQRHPSFCSGDRPHCGRQRSSRRVCGCGSQGGLGEEKLGNEINFMLINSTSYKGWESALYCARENKVLCPRAVLHKDVVVVIFW